jgi:hypothetical protein
MMLGAFALAVAATTQAAPTTAPTPHAAMVRDPNEKVCEYVPLIGSRLAKKRTCATRAEWAQRRLQDRQDAEYIQKGITTATCTAAKTNGTSTC